MEKQIIARNGKCMESTKLKNGKSNQCDGIKMMESTKLKNGKANQCKKSK